MIKHFFSQKNASIFITKEKNKIIGYITLRKHKNLGEIDFLAVIKKHQGKGVGQKLFRYVLDKASKLRIKKLLLEVRKDNNKAISIYEKHGFKKIETKKKKSITKIIMQK